MRVLFFLGFLVLSMLVPVGLSYAHVRPDLARADALIKSGKAEEAWKLLAPHEFEQAGKEDFDYILGIAALDSGCADKATLIFERVLTVNPNHAAARLDMARAYFALADFARAKAEFEAVLRFDPPQAARATIERYLAAIEERGQQKKNRLTGYVEATFGHDSNVNNSTAQNSIYVPLFGVDFNLTSSSVQARDNYLSLGAGGEVSHRLGSSGLSLFAGGDFRQRANYKLEAFENQSFDMRVGLQQDFERDLLRFSLGGNRYNLDGGYYRRMESLTGEWRHHADSRTQYSFFAQNSAIRYPQLATRSNSVNQFIAGAGGAKAFGAEGELIVFGSLFGGIEGGTDGRADGDKWLLGMRAGMQKALRRDADFFATGSLQYGKYELENPLFIARRRDAQLDVNLGVNWRMEPDWSLRPQLTYTRAESNFPIYEYDRYDISLTLRRDFR